MEAQTWYWVTLLLLVAIVILTDRKYGLLRDVSTAKKPPFSFARVQLTWWTLIILASLISILLATGQMPTLDSSTLILLGICSTTLATATAIDLSDQSHAEASKTTGKLSRNQLSTGFLTDILSDNSGISIHRFQTVAFNFIFGCWMVAKVFFNLKHVTLENLNNVIPVLEPNNLILIGLSSATYAALKTTENKQLSTSVIDGSTLENAEEQPVG